MAEGLGSRGQLFRFGECCFESRSLELRVRGELIKLEPKPLELLQHLLQHPGEVLTKDELLQALWPGRIPSESVLTKCVAKLRQGLRDEEQTLVKTVHGIGYRLMASVQTESVEGPLTPASLRELQPGDVPPLRPHWRLLQRLGSGGYGDVWLVEHSKTHERRVFKFAREAQRLAALKREITLYRVLRDTLGERADLVHLLDWNLEEAPYFIESAYEPLGSLQDWAQARGGLAGVPLEQRLDLAGQLAEALAAAHRAAVLHKDLKPSNLLLRSRADGALQLMLADFGSGRMLDESCLTALSITRLGFTQAGAGEGTSGTPLYLAPEILAGQPPTVQTDLYAAGVLLYQLVVGDLRRPLAPGWEQDVADELLREDIALAADGHPQRRLGDAGQLAERLRQLPQRRERLQLAREQARLTRQLREDLERSQLRRRWLRGIALALLAGVLASATGFWQARQAQQRAEQAAAEAQQVSDFLTGDLIAAADPLATGSREFSVRALLDEAARRLPDRFPDQPQAQIRIGLALSAAYRGLGDTGTARRLVDEAGRRAREALGADHELSLLAAVRRGDIALWTGDFEDAGMAYREALDARGLLGEQHPVILQARDGHAWVQFELGRYPQAAREYEALIADVRAATDRDEHFLTSLIWNLPEVYIELNRFDEAERLLRETLARFTASLGPDNPKTSEVQQSLGHLLMEVGRFDEAAPLLQQTYERTRDQLGPDHPNTLTALHFVGLLALHRGEPERALPLLRQALDGRRRVHGPEHPYVGYSENRVAEACLQLACADESLALARHAQSTAEGELGPAHPNSLMFSTTLAEAMARAGEGESAERLLREALRQAGQSLPADNSRHGHLQWSLARVLATLGRPREAAQAYAAAEAVFRAAPAGSQDWRLQRLAAERATLPPPI